MDILLLILRCLLLLLLAVLLAQPFWNQLLKPTKQKGWILIPRQNIHQVYTQFKPKVDSLTKAGYELHYFNNDFAAIDTLRSKTLADSVKANPIKTWVLLNKLSQQVPANLPVYVFVPNTLKSMYGTKPELPLNLQIQTYTPADSTAKWIQRAALISTGDAIKITEGNSKPGGTTFINSAVQSTERSNSAYQINIINGQPTVSYKGDTINKAVVVDTCTLRIAVYSDKAIDANYLIAALNSVKQFTQRKISIVKYLNPNNIPSGQNWLFWLSEQAIPASAKADKIFAYEPGKTQNVNSWINSGDGKIALTKHIPSQNTGEVVWPDGFGKPVLGLDKNIYHFSSRFDPSWSDLVWSDAFPKMMLNLLTNTDDENTHDKRTIDDKQLTPRLSTDKNIVTESNVIHKTDLSRAFWLALVLIFFIERVVAHRTKSTENHG